MKILKKSTSIKAKFFCPACRSLIEINGEEMNSYAHFNREERIYALTCPNCLNHIAILAKDINECVTYENQFDRVPTAEDILNGIYDSYQKKGE